MSDRGRARPRRRHRRRSRNGAAALLLALLAGPLTAAPAAQAAASPPATSAVSISVVSVTPAIPAPEYGLHPLRFRLSIANNTDAPLHKVQITAMRADPVTSTAQLDADVAHPTTPTSGQQLAPLHPVTVDLPPAGESAAIMKTFVTTSSVSASAELCQCTDRAVYPVWFGAYGVSDGASQLLGQTQTFVPSFEQRPAPTHVSWVWPIIDRPHRLTGTNTFTDDGLAASVTTGRLSRCLQVLENVAGKVPITVVIDPELLDELEVMATEKYSYFDASGQLVPGTGRQAAAAWLQRFQAVINGNSQVSVVLTPNGDPDVDALARAGLGWSATLPDAEQSRVRAALAGSTPDTTLAWPPSGTIGPTALRELAGTGVRSLLLDEQSVQPETTSTGAPITLARLRSGNSPIVAALTTPDLTRYTAAAVTGGGAGSSGLAELMAALALFNAQDSQPGQQAFLAPPRYVDPAVGAATKTILETSSSLITRPANLLNVVAGAGTAPLTQPPVATQARLQQQRRPPIGLPPADTRVARSVTNSISSLQAMFVGSSAARAFIDQLYNAVQLIESAAWRHGTGLGGRRLGVKFARHLRGQVSHLLRGVHIVRPASGSYTLASANALLPITVENDLLYPVHVQVAVRTVNSLPGLNAGVPRTQEIDPSSKATLHVPTQVQRSGTFKVFALLQTPDGRPFGPRIHLSVHSTVLGTVGVIIDIVSGTVLVLALIIRFVRRRRTRRSEPRPRRPWSPPTSASTADGAARGAADSSADSSAPERQLANP